MGAEDQSVYGEGSGLAEPPATVTLVRSLSCVSDQMILQVILSLETLLTMTTPVRSLSCVDSLVDVPVVRLAEVSRTEFAQISSLLLPLEIPLGRLPLVQPHVVDGLQVIDPEHVEVEVSHCE